MDFMTQTKNGRIGVAQKFITERNILGKPFFNFLHADIRLIEFGNQAENGQTIYRQTVRRHNLRPAKKEALKVVAADFPQILEFVIRFHFFCEQLEVEWPEIV